MDCPACGTELVAFRVPPVAREAAPDDIVAICPSCLALFGADAPDDPPAFSRIVESFPDGEAGAIMAVAVSLLADSVALHRRAIVALLDAVADRGEDPWLVVERLAASPTVAPDADLDRARRQLAQLLDR